MLDQSLDWKAVARERAGKRLGRQVVYRDAVPSTNLLARTLARAGAADGTLVLTDDQTHGRGRLGRRWVVPPRSGLTVSIILCVAAEYPLHALTPAVALAVFATVDGYAPRRVSLKWPNDVLLDGAKVCGILVELDERDGGWTAIIGIGLNVNAAPDLPTATYLAAALGAPVPRELLLLTLLSHLEHYVNLLEDVPDSVLAAWRDRLVTLGQRVRVRTPRGEIVGTALDVDGDGSLIVRADDGARHTVRAGDVTLAPSK